MHQRKTCSLFRMIPLPILFKNLKFSPLTVSLCYLFVLFKITAHNLTLNSEPVSEINLSYDQSSRCWNWLNKARPWILWGWSLASLYALRTSTTDESLGCYPIIWLCVEKNLTKISARYFTSVLVCEFFLGKLRIGKNRNACKW